MVTGGRRAAERKRMFSRFGGASRTMHKHTVGQRALFGMSARWDRLRSALIGQLCVHRGRLHRVRVVALGGGLAQALPFCRPAPTTLDR